MAEWPEANLVKREDYNIRWYRIEEGQIEVLASEGDMRRTAIDTWAALLRELIDTRPKDKDLFLVLDLTGPKQGFTPYASGLTRDLAQYVLDHRDTRTYVAVLLKNSLLIGLIAAFFQQIFARETKLKYRLFSNEADGLAWLTGRIAEEHPDGA